jgi:hypothetical protein
VHHVRQHGLRRGGAQHDQQLVLDVGQEAQDREAGQPRDGAEHEQNEQEAREIESDDELGEIPQ